MTIQTTDPRVAGLVASVGSTCVYANLAAGYCTKLLKFGATATDWVEEHSGGFWGPLVTADPRTAGRAALIGDLCSYVTGGTMTRLLKYGVLNTDWIKFDAPAPVGGGGIADGDYGDITVGGTGTTMTIDAGTVTYAKMQAVSATDKILGRSNPAAGVVQEIACTAAGRALIDDADTSEQRATLGIGATDPGTQRIATGQFVLQYKRLTLSGVERLTLEGTAEVYLDDFDAYTEAGQATPGQHAIGQPYAPATDAVLQPGYFAIQFKRLSLERARRLTLQRDSDFILTDFTQPAGRAVLQGRF